MARQIALLRGINLGPNKRVDMAHLRELMSAMGYADVKTHLQSGNVVFTTTESTDSPPDRTAKRIEDHLAEQLGFTVRVVARTRDELAAVIDRNPLRDVVSDPSRYLIHFLSAAPDSTWLDGLASTDFAPDMFLVADREIYAWCPNGFRNSKLALTLTDTRLPMTVTARNWNTVTKLLALADG